MEKSKVIETKQARLANIASYLDQIGNKKDGDFLRFLLCDLQNAAWTSEKNFEQLRHFFLVCDHDWKQWDGKESRCELCGLWRIDSES